MNISRAFTLIELLVVIGILSILAALLSPALSNVKGKARQLQCAVNLASLGKSFAIYASDSRDSYPAAYYYRGMALGADGETPSTPIQGYVHWSGILLGGRWIEPKALCCPAFDRGGLPPANTTSDNLENNQKCETEGVVDDQAARCAFTVNQALFPANHFITNFQGAIRPTRHVKDMQVRSPSRTIMATEWSTDWQMLVEDSSAPVCRSYLPVHGFLGLGPALANNRFDTRLFGCQRACWAAMRCLAASDLSASPALPASKLPRLDWVGRNHARRSLVGTRSSNFLNADGHVANSTIFDTLAPFQWGQEFYSLQPGNDIAN
jgi:prepilin-type N-terminal cleavage/methylation domain-containing protein